MPGSKKVQETFNSGLNYSQSIIAQYAEHYQLDVPTACKLATGFGGGMGRMGGTCGALTGAYLVLGLEYGSENSTQKDKKDQTYEKIQYFTQKFEQKNGACQCRELLGCDISTAEGFQQAREQGLTKTRCPGFVRDAVDILEDIINKDK
ncbi:MAG: C-GCAxxG-C-C family protein [gamma proteobacterium symbiont of Bathyaustriella thionipta]|nr:C-GCAxxG-C-C family protein [gamma proteobacterium symbiont of Bathyaustriella thionipta]MCU7950990.1 C-GCAxxG-C-C family protein [gamma proteobacterium symbiont of Bathyaustriella thionipta]MCU7951807.1 C-GCAxxG-C-C family protein [gamma proteobacterium symbiont of Bathyaustriella thionipta]MCU7957492.1 C-GCAxxG-C-C family protein [gamma proteobacterium symbiont of Bathyaustriella thionipta]MCU7967334.1 C-GCAxxG-C-C family protein [gamma proteobacterium symbiont of Bathyaustriella thionipta